MKTIVIATTNQDKFLIVKKILTDLGLKNWIFKNLSNYKIKGQAKESGTIEQRAKEKACYFRKNVDLREMVDVILGIDDGFSFSGTKKVITDSKKLTQQILSNNKMKIGENIVNLRAYYFLITKNNKELTTRTAIEFTFLGNKHGLQRTDGIYPLSYVLGYKGTHKTVSETRKKEVENLNLKYSKKSLTPIVKILLKI